MATSPSSKRPAPVATGAARAPRAPSPSTAISAPPPGPVGDGPSGPADPEAFARVQAAAEAELGPEAPEVVGADVARPEGRPSADASGAPGVVLEQPEDEGPPNAGDVELVIRTLTVGLGLAVGLRWPELGERVRRAAPAGSARFARHFGPRLGHAGLWAGLAVVASFLDPAGPRARDAVVEVGP